MLRKSLLFFLFLLFGSHAFAGAQLQPVASSTELTPQCYYVKKQIKPRHFEFVRVCRDEKSFEKRVDDFLNSLSVEQQSALQKRIDAETKISKSRYGIALYEPTYILPFYYTGSPDQAVYLGTTPDNQAIQHQEFKAQMSFLLELWPHMFKSPVSLNVSYTQLSYWQFYAKSQWFRETNYEPALFFSSQFTNNTLFYFGAVHESNGRGGELERSWNRLFADFMISGANWLIDIKPWILIFKSNSSDLHNPDICKYLGYGRVVFAWKFYRQELSFELRNTVASGFQRGTVIAAYSFPLAGKLNGYIQFFTGYGQSLIEYNHYTNSVGIGININNWI